MDEYVTELKSRSRHCEFGASIRDRIVAGIQDAKVRQRLLRETDLSLDKAISICRAREATKKQVEKMAASPNKIVLKCLETWIYPELVSTVETCIKEDGVRLMAKCAINVESGTILPQDVNRNQYVISNKNSLQAMKELSFS